MFRSLILWPLASLFLNAMIANALPHSPRNSHIHQIGSRHLGKRATTDDYVAYAAAGIDQLQTWYNAANGLWDNAWWNSANVLTMLADFQICFPSKAEPTTNLVFPVTLAQAPNTFAGYINGFYDDELWWVLAWIRVFDVTKDEKYLDLAAEIFEDSKKAWGDTPCGGLWWDKAHTSIGAVENELYLTAAARLANRRPSTPSGGYYFNEAIKAYEWFVASGLINSDNLINNGLKLETCVNDGLPVLTYNQGILLGGLVDLNLATGDAKYINLANTIANATISTMTDDNGILHENICEQNGCNTDLQQFKGIFGRNIQYLHETARLSETTKEKYRTFLQKNADSIWAFDQADNQLGLIWSGPIQKATVMTQSSALDAIVGAACVSS